MNLDLKKLPAKIAPLIKKVRQYIVFIFFILLIGMYGFLVYRINTLTSTEPDETKVTEQLQTIKRPRIDQDAVNKIQELEDENIEVQSIFEQARENPFSE